jgi:hypothetical protein
MIVVTQSSTHRSFRMLQIERIMRMVGNVMELELLPRFIPDLFVLNYLKTFCDIQDRRVGEMMPLDVLKLIHQCMLNRM